MCTCNNLNHLYKLFKKMWEIFYSPNKFRLHKHAYENRSNDYSYIFIFSRQRFIVQFIYRKYTRYRARSQFYRDGEVIPMPRYGVQPPRQSSFPIQSRATTHRYKECLISDFMCGIALRTSGSVLPM